MPRHASSESRQPAGLRLIDTNVILRYLVGDDPSKAAPAAALMERVEKAEESVEISDEVITEVVWTLESYYAVPRQEIAQHLAGVINFTGVRVSSRKTLVRALQSFAATNADFVDCLLAARGSLRKITVYTFDETDFKKLGCDWERP